MIEARRPARVVALDHSQPPSVIRVEPSTLGLVEVAKVANHALRSPAIAPVLIDGRWLDLYVDQTRKLFGVQSLIGSGTTVVPESDSFLGEHDANVSIVFGIQPSKGFSHPTVRVEHAMGIEDAGSVRQMLSDRHLMRADELGDVAVARLSARRQASERGVKTAPVPAGGRFFNAS